MEVISLKVKIFYLNGILHAESEARTETLEYFKLFFKEPEPYFVSGANDILILGTTKVFHFMRSSNSIM